MCRKYIKRVTIILAGLTTCIFIQAQIGINTENVPTGHILSIDGKGDDPLTGTPSVAQAENNIVIDNGGKLGIGQLVDGSNIARMQIGKSGTMVITDPTVNKGKILTNDVNGIGTWQNNDAITMVTGQGNGTGIVYPYDPALGYKYTGAYIDLPVGRWDVNYLDILTGPKPDLTTSGKANIAEWIVLTLSDNTTDGAAASSGPTECIDGSSMYSGSRTYGGHGNIIRGTITLLIKPSQIPAGQTTKRFYLKTRPSTMYDPAYGVFINSLGSLLWDHSAFYAYKLGDI